MLPQSFYNQKTLKVAQDLLGCFLVKDKKKYRIIETEAYNGPSDKASHASRGQTERNTPMFSDPGTIYIYLVYGMHHMLNIVTEKSGYPAAVLIREVEDLETGNKYNGPAKLTKALGISKDYNNLLICNKKNGLYIEPRQEIIKNSQIFRTPRVGIDYAEEYRDKLWRFLLVV